MTRYTTHCATCDTDLAAGVPYDEVGDPQTSGLCSGVRTAHLAKNPEHEVAITDDEAAS